MRPKGSLRNAPRHYRQQLGVICLVSLEKDDKWYYGSSFLFSLDDISVAPVYFLDYTVNTKDG